MATEASTRIRLGMIGGGEGAFIGAVHRIAARLDDRYAFVAGALASTPAKARRSGAALGLEPERSYADFDAMLATEARRPDGIEAVAIVTPNHVHAPAALACLKAGLHVICDKPLTTTLAQALDLRAAAIAASRIFAVTYNYSGYPMVRHAREIVAAGEIGDVRLVQVQYAQDWLTEALETTGQKQADWRTDPARSGEGGCIGDIGTHAYQLAHFVVGVPPQSLLADLSTFVPDRRVDDMHKFCCATKMARAAPCGRVRSRPGTRTISRCASMVRMAASNGGRNIRTSCSGRRSAHRLASSREERMR
jgi:predicted dehydrogenase